MAGQTVTNNSFEHGQDSANKMVRYEEDQDRYIADDKYVIRRRVMGEHEEWQIRHISSRTWTSADTILEMAEAIRQAQQHYTERGAQAAGFQAGFAES